MKKLIIAAVAASLAATLNAAWRNLDDSAWVAGPKLTEADLAGKVVLVDQWGIHCPPCLKLMPQLEKYWKAYKSKAFVLIGSHHQQATIEEIRATVAAKKVTYPVYAQGDLVGGPSSEGIPFMYVVNHLGQVVYSGGDHRAAIEAVVDALGQIGKPPSIIPGIMIDKKSSLKSLEKQLVLGKPVASAEKKLQNVIKAAEKKSATAKVKEDAELAKRILAALEDSKKSVKSMIESAKAADPEEAYKLAQLYVKSFPEEGAGLKDELPELKAKAAEAKKAAKK